MSNCLPNLVTPKTPDFSREESPLAPPPPGGTVLIDRPDIRQSLTSNRETDVTYALVRGLKEYIEQLSIETQAARVLLFAQVVEVHAAYELQARYPAAAVSPLGDTKYDSRKFVPSLTEILKDDVGEAYASLVLGASHEAVVDIQLEVWASDEQARVMLVAMLEDAFLPTDWSSAVRLMLPHYHGVHAVYLQNSVGYQDDGTARQRGIHRAMFKVTGRCPLIRMFKRPLGKPRFNLNSIGPNGESTLIIDPAIVPPFVGIPD